MKPDENEALARILINEKIKKSGWNLNPLKNEKVNENLNKEITITDYTFLDENDHPIMLLEA